MNGLGCFSQGMSLIAKPGLRQYVLIPFLINAVVLSVFIVYGLAQYDRWMAQVAASLPAWAGFLSWIIGVLALLVGIAVLLYGFLIIGNIIAAPFNAILAVKVEEYLLGRPLTSSIPFSVVLVRAIGREIVKLLYYVPRVLGLLLLSFIPVLNALAPFLWLGFGAWMMAIQFADYSADNNGISFTELRRRMSQNKVDALLFGLLAYVLVAIPLLNLILIPAAVAGGTVFWINHLVETREQSA